MNPSQQKKKVKFSLGLNQQEGAIEKGQNVLLKVSLLVSTRYMLKVSIWIRKSFSTWPFQQLPEKTLPLAGLRPALSLLALQQHLSGGCIAITTQGPWGWTLSFYANKVCSHLSAVVKEQGLGLCVVRFSNKYRNIYSSYLWKQTSGSSAKTNTERDICSLRFYLQCSGGIRRGCVALDGFNRRVPSSVSVRVFVCTWVSAALSVFLSNCRKVQKRS